MPTFLFILSLTVPALAAWKMENGKWRKVRNTEAWRVREADFQGCEFIG